MASDPNVPSANFNYRVVEDFVIPEFDQGNPPVGQIRLVSDPVTKKLRVIDSTGADALVGGGIPGGPTESIQFNNNGEFDGNFSMTYDPVDEFISLAVPLEAGLATCGINLQAIGDGTGNGGTISILSGGFVQDSMAVAMGVAADGFTPTHGQMLIQNHDGPNPGLSIDVKAAGAPTGQNITVNSSGVAIQAAIDAFGNPESLVFVGSDGSASVVATTAINLNGAALGTTPVVNIADTGGKVGFLGKTAVVRQATPVTLGDVIAVLRAFGLVI